MYVRYTTTTPLKVRLSGQTKLNTIIKTILVINIITVAISNTTVNVTLNSPISRNNIQIFPNNYRIPKMTNQAKAPRMVFSSMK